MYPNQPSVRPSLPPPPPYAVPRQHTPPPQRPTPRPSPGNQPAVPPPAPYDPGPYAGFPAGLVPHQRGWSPDFLEADPGRPGTVTAAVVMAYIGAAVQGLAGVLLLFGSASREFVKGFAANSGIGAASAGVIAVLGLFCLVMAAIVLVGAVLAQEGRNLGRIALSVVGGLGMLMQVYSIATGGFLAVISLLWIATACAMLWTTRASDWYRRRRAAGRTASPSSAGYVV